VSLVFDAPGLGLDRAADPAAGKGFLDAGSNLTARGVAADRFAVISGDRAFALLAQLQAVDGGDNDRLGAFDEVSMRQAFATVVTGAVAGTVDRFDDRGDLGAITRH
jgi:hypothetical protein